MATVPPSAVVPLEERPLEERFTLPDMTPVQYREADSHDRIDVQLGAAAQKDSELAPLAAFVKTDVQSRISLHGAVNADRAVSEHVWEFRAPGDAAVEISAFDAWAALYAFWVRRDHLERQPVQLGASLANRDHLYAFITQTGLGFHAPDSKDTYEVLLDRSSFWQGAGAPRSRSWLQAHVPSVSDFGPLASTAFPHTISFTRSDDPPVLTTHPLRPPKPAPGAVLYSRWVHSVKQHLTLTHIDANNPEHFEAYCRWQNSDRVNVGWREKGDEAHHRKYHAGRLADPHIMGFLVAWDGELAGYGEASFNKEDGMAAFAGGMGDYDQGTHLLIGESKFRGRHRFAAHMVSMKHFAFLREPRTQIVIGEPRVDLSIVPLLQAHLPQDRRKVLPLPHKDAVLFILHRDRFFIDGIFF
ncbi:putative acyltransferase [Tilletiopsis washingtonensis]|uniref:Putative acyltransferase n=1 Tax=Tilletiopsis washingtonensis TaxID=58919 RepID=A0A316Z6W3_9BASI|nr:putative acyltransferase [Tilletiopsis washingtonensis]PWN96804.1 putative acyltransferase [Tilletiopsis washingtonensis]